MFLKAVVTVTLFTTLLGAADIFSVRSFLDPKTKAKIPVTPELFFKTDPKLLLPHALKAAQEGQCAIPLTQAKPAKVHDGMAQFAGPSHDPGGVIPPPAPACQGWN